MTQMNVRPDEAHFLEYDSEAVGSMTGGSGLHTPLAHLVRHVQTESRPHPEEVMERFAALAPEHIRGADQASVMLCGRRGLRSSAVEGSCTYLIDEIQDELREGPALDCAATSRTVRVDDLTADSPWPRFAQFVLAETPVRSMLVFHLYTGVQTLGAMSLYSHRPRGLDDTAEELGLILATHAALTLEAVQRSRQFRSALGSRDIIGQAKGILMERYEISPAAAFSLLTKLSQESNKPVVVIAKELVETKPKTGRA
jgi:transcriptional regulator with GAF, ATPase, and Fis domain